MWRTIEELEKFCYMSSNDTLRRIGSFLHNWEEESRRKIAILTSELESVRRSEDE